MECRIAHIQAIAVCQVFKVRRQLIGFWDLRAVEQQGNHWDVALKGRRDLDAYVVFLIVQATSALVVERSSRRGEPRPRP